MSFYRFVMLLQAKVSTPPSATVKHHHYNYSFKFNKISLNCTIANCNLEEQTQLSVAQKNLKVSQLINKGNYLVYHGKKCCIIANAMNTERANAAKMTRHFPCKVVLLNQVLHPKLMYQKKMSLKYSIHVISTSTVQKSFDVALNSVLSGRNFTVVTNDLAKVFKQELQMKSREIATQCSRKITSELPITGWLHEYLSHNLDF